MSYKKKTKILPNLALTAFVGAIALQQGYGFAMGRDAAISAQHDYSLGKDFDCAAERYLKNNNTNLAIYTAGSLPIGLVLGYQSAKPAEVETPMVGVHQVKRCL